MFSPIGGSNSQAPITAIVAAVRAGMSANRTTMHGIQPTRAMYAKFITVA